MSKLLSLINWREHCDADTAAKADQWQLQIQESFGQLVLTMGKALREMKGLMPHGAFEAWYSKELGLNRKSVSDYMRASETLEQLPPDSKLADAAPRQLAILGRGGPKALSKATALMIEKGSVTEKDARQIVNGDDVDAKQEEEKPKPPNSTQRIATLIDQNGLLTIENNKLKLILQPPKQNFY